MTCCSNLFNFNSFIQYVKKFCQIEILNEIYILHVKFLKCKIKKSNDINARLSQNYQCYYPTISSSRIWIIQVHKTVNKQ